MGHLYVGRQSPRKVPIVPSAIEEGIKGYDESIVFSPVGAAWMLEKLANAIDLQKEAIL